MLRNPMDLAAMAEALGRSPDYRVLRRLIPREPCKPAIGRETKTAILLDTETTGLDHRKDELIELGMVKFDYTPDGRIIGVRDTFSAFNEPSEPIPAEITALTGITDEMVAGHKIGEAAVNAFVDDSVVLVIAHNSGFDRKFSERYWPVFEAKAWGCSATEIDWRRHGFEGARLGYLLNGAGFFHQAHRAVDDCHALLEILALELPTGAPALALLLETARRQTVRVWAEQSPFELKDSLKRRGYRWSDGSDGRPRSWYIDVRETALDDEIAFLKAEIYLRDVEPRLQTLTAFTRFSVRV